VISALSVLPDSFAQVLVCPRTKHPLVYFPRGERDVDEADAFLLCPAARLRYRFEDGVPALLPEEAEELSEQATATLIARAKQLGLRLPG
jgi:uncharacterized protein YbaR (Trm112 family)